MFPPAPGRYYTSSAIPRDGSVGSRQAPARVVSDPQCAVCFAATTLAGTSDLPVVVAADWGHADRPVGPCRDCGAPTRYRLVDPERLTDRQADRAASDSVAAYRDSMTAAEWLRTGWEDVIDGFVRDLVERHGLDRAVSSHERAGTAPGG